MGDEVVVEWPALVEVWSAETVLMRMGWMRMRLRLRLRGLTLV